MWIRALPLVAVCSCFVDKTVPSPTDAPPTADARTFVDAAPAFDSLAVDSRPIIDGRPAPDGHPPCPPGYVWGVEGGSCYRASTSGMPWVQAEADCEGDVFNDIPAHLAVVQSAEESQLVWALGGGSSIWIGLSDHLDNGTFLWVTGAPATYTDWGFAEPNEAVGTLEQNTEDCVEYRYSTGYWNDFRCPISQRYVCEWDGVPPAVTATYCDTDQVGSCGECSVACTGTDECANQECLPPLPVCPGGYTGNRRTQTCYRVVSTAATWLAAEADCEDDVFMSTGAHLAVIQNAEEGAHLLTLISGSFWMGLSDHVTEGTFLWVTGVAPSYTNWGPSEPNNGAGGTEDCGEYAGMTDQWNDFGCTLLRRYICEWDGAPPATPATYCDTSMPANCGTCGNACLPVEQCVAQMCELP